MSKRTRSRSFKIPSRKKPETEEIKIKGLPGKWEISAIVCMPCLGPPQFMAALEKSKLVELATEAYKARQISKNEFLLGMGMKREKWNEGIERAVKQFNDALPKAFYAAALITATQTSPFLSRRHSLYAGSGSGYNETCLESYGSSDRLIWRKA